MDNNFPDLNNPPPEIYAAAEAGELVIFVGAGISLLVGFPSWDEFADEVIKQLVPDIMDYHELSQIKTLSDPKKRLSIAKIVAQENRRRLKYKDIFTKDLPTENHVYSHLNRFDCVFVTTNYDKSLAPESRKVEPESNWRFNKRKDLLKEKLDNNGNVIHLHGSIDDEDEMVITTSDYLACYSSLEVITLLTYLFKHKTVLFIGYRLEEIEILEYILRQGNVGNNSFATGDRLNRFMLQGFFNADVSLFNKLHEYYRSTFGVELMGFSRDLNDYHQQADILANWVTKLDFQRLTLTDQAIALRGEING